jgi:hypothetical protein
VDLAKHVPEVKKHPDICYDILRNAGVSFAYNDGRNDFGRDIKLWINKMISEVKSMFPKFKDNMRELFMGGVNSVTDMEDEIEFEIGSKISENSESYLPEEIEEPGIKIKSPQISRVLIKWISELHRMLFSSEEVISDYRTGFKSMYNLTSLYLPSDRKQKLIRNLQNIAISKMVPLNQQRKKELLLVIDSIFTLVQ